MSQCTRNVEFLAADFGYLYGRVDFFVRPGGKRYRYVFSCSGDNTICEIRWDGEMYTPTEKPRRITDAELVELLGPTHLTMQDFVSMWQGWAAGYEKGHSDGVYEARKRS